MKRKNFISFILILFFLSTTGVPQVIQQCNLTGEKSFDVCAACSEEEHKEMESCCEVEPVAEPSCCEDEATAASSETDGSCAVTTPADVSCCSDQVNLLKISDDFSVSGSNKTGDQPLSVVTILDLSTGFESFTSKVSELHNIPPPLFGKDLLFSIHQLKIAAPLS